MRLACILLFLPLLSLGQQKSLSSKPTNISNPHLPLSIGDAVPAFQLTNIINYKSPSVNLSSFKGKLLVIDFWEAWCTSCIKALPRLDSLNKRLSGQVQVITVTSSGNASSILAELKRFKTTKNISLPIIVNDTLLHKYFPHRLISHTVWIDAKGIVRAITGADYVTTSNINQMLSGKPVSWPVKEDALDFNYNTSALELSNSEAAPLQLWYSSLTPYRPGLNSITSVSEDSAAGTEIANYYNLSLLQLATLSLYNASALPNLKKLRLFVSDTSRYFFNAGTQFYQNWQQQNAWCFSSALPLSLSKQQRQKFISGQLAAWLHSMFGITASIQKITAPAWVFTFNGDTSILRTNGSPPSQDLDNTGPVKSITNRPITELVAFLNEKVPGIPWVINETGLPRSKRMDLQLNLYSFSNFDSLRAALLPYGFILTQTEREIELVVITENKYQQHPLIKNQTGK